MKVALRFENTKMITEPEQQLTVDLDALLLERLKEAYQELRQAVPRGDLYIHLYIKGEVTTP